MDLDKEEAEHFKTFTYDDGLRDGELGLLNGKTLSSKHIIIYLLMDLGYDENLIAELLCISKQSVLMAFVEVQKYVERLNKIKKQIATKRLLNAIKNFKIKNRFYIKTLKITLQ